MLAAILAALLLPVGPAAPAAYLCSEFDQNGAYELGTACRADEAERQMEASRRAREEETDRFLRDEQRKTDDVMRDLLLDDRLRDLDRRTR